MAKDYSYKPYKSGQQAQSRRVKMLMLLLIVVIVGLVILIKSKKQTGSVSPESTQPPQVSLDHVLPSPPQPAPQTPPVAAPAVEPVPVPAETLEPIAESKPALDAAAVVEPNVAKDVPAAETADGTSLEAKQLIEKALKLRESGKFIAARDLLNEALRMPLSPAIRQGVKTQMADLSGIWLFDRGVMEGDKMTSRHQVQPGELLVNIGKQYKVPYEILLKINKLERPELLKAGQQIKVIHGPFNVSISRSTFTMDVYLQDVFVKSYKVGLGTEAHTTPTGRWQVLMGGKMIKPTWTDPDTGKTYLGTDPDYPLGSRWIALEGMEGDARGRTGFAIHGTKDPETIGTRSSRGCIRLYNGDVIEVYDLMEPGQSTVIVKD